ncbi:hypothetical protein [Patulibacter sp. SYSU D01012]|uniref:hypothetical protein n=1 Tax=Patulibacter sp. SYSU D01012 TaxID=2817381 RepID=UPI001B3020CE|nr:hypothetical protein [Patulibacter sp. SYSU D01012]
MHRPALSRRGAAVAAAAAALAAVVVVVLVLVLRGGGPAPADRAEAYARAWQETCAGLAADGRRTSAAVARAATATADPDDVRRAAAAVAAPYVARTVRRLQRVAAAEPPPAWAGYHRRVRPAIAAAAGRAQAVLGRVRAGDVDALGDVDLGAVERVDAPAELRRRTPACTGDAG